MGVLAWATGGAVVGAVLVWVLATWHHWDVLPDDLQAAFSAIIGGALSFLGGFTEHRRAERQERRRRAAAPAAPDQPESGSGGPPGVIGPGETPGP